MQRILCELQSMITDLFLIRLILCNRLCHLERYFGARSDSSVVGQKEKGAAAGVAHVLILSHRDDDRISTIATRLVLASVIDSGRLLWAC